MADTSAEYAKPEPKPEVIEEVVTTTRSIIGGHPEASVRRIVLYLVAGLLVITPVAPLAIVPLILLAVTDQLA